MRPAKQYEYKDYTGSFRLSKADAEKAPGVRQIQGLVRQQTYPPVHRSHDRCRTKAGKHCGLKMKRGPDRLDRTPDKT
jgi:hypothetical protein